MHVFVKRRQYPTGRMSEVSRVLSINVYIAKLTADMARVFRKRRKPLVLLSCVVYYADRRCLQCNNAELGWNWDVTSGLW